jgi:VanZ family protein
MTASRNPQQIELRHGEEVCSFCAVFSARNFAKYWLPTLLWMLLIFSASSDTSSAVRSSRIIGPILHWLCPSLPQEKVERIVLAVRKCAHFVEYAVLAVLLWYALWMPHWGDQRPWSWAVAGFALALSVAYAGLDEFHQMFVPTRQGSVWDVLLDSSGAVAGLVLAALVYGWLARRRARQLARR